MSDFPRRAKMEEWTRAEKAITIAKHRVEEMGAHRHLTEAVILLGRAQDRVADFVEGLPAPEDLPEPDIEIVRQGDGRVVMTINGQAHLPVPKYVEEMYTAMEALVAENIELKHKEAGLIVETSKFAPAPIDLAEDEGEELGYWPKVEDIEHLMATSGDPILYPQEEMMPAAKKTTTTKKPWYRQAIATVWSKIVIVYRWVRGKLPW